MAWENAIGIRTEAQGESSLSGHLRGSVLRLMPDNLLADPPDG
jgi:hypothetical protein